MELSLEPAGIQELKTYFAAAAVALARMLGLLFVMPVFTRLGLNGLLRTATALVFSLPILPLIFAQISPQIMPYDELAPILLKEIVVGVVIGLVLGIPIWAAEAAGEVLDMQRAAQFADIADPNSTVQNNITGTFFALLIVVIYFAIGGLSLTLRTAYESYTLWPVQNFMPILDTGSAALLLGLLDDILKMGLMLVIPIVLAFLLSDLCMGLIARAAPQMNIFILSLTVKNLAFAVLLVLYGVFLVTYMREGLGQLTEAIPKLELFAPSR